MNPRHLIGHALGAAPSEGSVCAVCGVSPYAVGRPAKDVFGPAFTDYDLLWGEGEDVCEGCAAMLGGKPSRENPPLRMGHFAVIGGALERPDGERMVEILRDPPDDLQALGWTSSRQRHASLRAGSCGGGVLQIGTEQETITWDVSRDVALLDAVSTLRRHAHREHILTGQYPPHVIASLGAAWEPAEGVVATYRPSLSLDMAVHLVRRPPQQEEDPVPMMESQRIAARLLLHLTVGSKEREADPIRYWSSLLPRRLAAAVGRHRTLADIAARLIEDTLVEPLHYATQAGVAMIEDLSPEQATEIVDHWRAQPRLIIALVRALKEEDRVSTD